MTDYRTPENRVIYFDALYRATLEHRCSPGMVYLYLPFLRDKLGWDKEQCLWFAFLNGMTQNPLTSLRLFRELPEPPRTPQALVAFSQWFDATWKSLQYDTDRRYGKAQTVAAIKSYCKLLWSLDTSQESFFLPINTSWDDLWNCITTQVVSFGRLSAWSYLEYVHIYGAGHQPGSMLFDDVSGSRSHRNGMLFLMGFDDMVDDKRAAAGFQQRGEKQDRADFSRMCGYLETKADKKLLQFGNLKDAGRFTFESALCAFKNSFFGRRYMGVYADMGWERLQWYKANIGMDVNYHLIMEARTALPGWLREEAQPSSFTLKQKAAIFRDTGVPYRAEHFL